MEGHSFFGKRKLCYTEVSDFTNYQGLGKDPLYKRFDSVYSIIKRYIPIEYQHFLSTPEYVKEEDIINWHISEWKDTPVKLTDLTGEVYKKYKSIKEKTLSVYNKVLFNLKGEDLPILASALKYQEDQYIYCCDDKVYLIAWGMAPDLKQYKVKGTIVHEFDFIKKYTVTFDPGDHGTLLSKINSKIKRNEGVILSEKDIPTLQIESGWVLKGWTPTIVGSVVTSDLSFVAQYCEDIAEKPLEEPVCTSSVQPTKKQFICRFDAGKNGTIEGVNTIRKEEGSILSSNEIPYVKVNKGYHFKEWNISPLNTPINSDKVFIAEYEEIIPWYKSWWIWFCGLFKGKGCLRWLIWLLIFIVGLWLLSYWVDSCGNSSHDRRVKPIQTIQLPDGRVVDDNGFSHPITGDDGKLPDDNNIVAPVMEEGETELPIIENPGVPNIIANRLFLFMEEDNDNIEALAEDFKKVYPEEKYSIIGYDKEVKMIVIQIPEGERDNIRRTINNRIPNHKFIVFDEEIYELRGQENIQPLYKGWHLDAIHLEEGWKITQGSSDIRIAVVDDGIEAGHPIFSDRIVDAYNVFTKDNRLSLGQGHGTHTAGIAAGSTDFYEKGASGIAPNCLLMPIQVFDNEKCPLSALIAGVMYAIHHDADVINLSVGPSFKGLNMLPIEQQEQIAKNQFKNVERLWKRVCNLAEEQNSILVFAAGNDNILSSIPPENRSQSAIVVSAVDDKLYPTEFTNYGSGSDISAPGKDIFSAYPEGSFKYFDGTSMAAPIVSGTIALMKSLKKDLTVEQARNILYRTGKDVFGNIPPMLLVNKALEGLRDGDFSKGEERDPQSDSPSQGKGSSANDDTSTPSKGSRDSLEDGDISNDNNDKPIFRGSPDTPSENGETPNPDQNMEGGQDSSDDVRNPQMENPSEKKSPEHKNETDYDAIRRLIEKYKQKISELEKLLPNK